MKKPANEHTQAHRRIAQARPDEGFKTNRVRYALSRAPCACAVWLVTACTLPIDEQGQGPHEPVADVSQAIWEDGCDFTPEDHFDEDSFAHHTQSSYDHPSCHKTWIAEVQRLRDGDNVLVRDIGPRPTTRAACENLWMSVQVVEQFRLCPPSPRSCWHDITEDGDPKYTKRGEWTGRCELPRFYLSEFGGEFPNLAAVPYRVYATSRSSRNGATRPIVFEPPVI
jgi:hypothetical protein